VDLNPAHLIMLPAPPLQGTSGSKLYYSVDVGPAHIIMLGCYTEYHKHGEQWRWLKKDLRSIDRNLTPWVIVGMHAPWWVGHGLRTLADTQAAGRACSARHRRCRTCRCFWRCQLWEAAEALARRCQGAASMRRPDRPRQVHWPAARTACLTQQACTSLYLQVQQQRGAPAGDGGHAPRHGEEAAQVGRGHCVCRPCGASTHHSQPVSDL
jgi:hypothetical protein